MYFNRETRRWKELKIKIALDLFQILPAVMRPLRFNAETLGAANKRSVRARGEIDPHNSITGRIAQPNCTLEKKKCTSNARIQRF